MLTLSFYTVECSKEQTLLGGTDFSLNTAVIIVVFCFLDLISVIVLIGQSISVIWVLNRSIALDLSVGFISQQTVFTEPLNSDIHLNY
jgi:hypothetical protein